MSELLEPREIGRLSFHLATGASAGDSAGCGVEEVAISRERAA